MEILWPDTLPLPTVQGYNIHPGDTILQTEMGELPTYAMKAKANQGHYCSENKIYQKDLQVIKGQKNKRNLEKLEAIAKPVNPLKRRPKDKD